jgi:hypothetical protein
MKPKLFLHNAETRECRATLIAARQRLAEITDDAPEAEYLAANSAVIRAEQPLARYQRLDIDAGRYDHPAPEMEA